ncbi:MAG: ABC-F family ATP-binding cassette domain-containing protein [Eubacteriales bacterium]|uniref:ribosomal protection-like ABC-F family protein n=1 Tax=Fenollaria sp. TaxID=1965292 RepID=UPI002A74797C|nr:ABC-F family ATP-binding cassette domain-containing protein [Fenollaria sp.]MDD7339161.1 ABC-F family ATP-binding cassette domain-containing protein [Eubacteriales bacterium]MDY3105812.1 ABC-F family ATP-binding cassette domain-containing protein [Fenollaria sp.]
MTVLACNNIKKVFIDKLIFENVSININEGEKVAIVGMNGTGKSTLLNILSGMLNYDEGDIFISKDTKIAYLEQNTTIRSSLNVYDEMKKSMKHLTDLEEELRNFEDIIAKDPSQENLDRYAFLLEDFEKKGGYTYDAEIKKVLTGLGFGEEQFTQPFNSLSGGQKSKLMLAKALIQESDILFLDEPTNHLDIDSMEFLQEYINSFNKTVVMVSHDRYFLNATCNKVILIKDHTTHEYNMGYEQYIKQRKINEAIQEKAYINQQKEIERQKEIIRRFRSYATEKSIIKAKSREKMLAKIELLSDVNDDSEINFKFRMKIESGNDVLAVENINKSFGDFKLLNDINFNIYKREHVGIIGANGIGKSTLFKIILGEESHDSGEIRFGTNVNVGYFDQELEKLDVNKSIAEEIWDSFPRLTYFELRKALAKFLFIDDDIYKMIDELSGGEKARVSLCKIMLSDVNFLVLDEPTNHLDIESKEVLEEALNSYEGTLLVISHDRYFLNKVVNKILELKADGIHEFLGNYDYYLDKKKRMREEEAFLEEPIEITKTQAKLNKKREREEKERLKKEKQAKDALEKEISELEKHKDKIHNELANPDIYDDIDRVNDLNFKLTEIDEKLDALYEELIYMEE